MYVFELIDILESMPLTQKVEIHLLGSDDYYDVSDVDFIAGITESDDAVVLSYEK
jgi:hypothetical protein